MKELIYRIEILLNKHSQKEKQFISKAELNKSINDLLQTYHLNRRSTLYKIKVYVKSIIHLILNKKK